MCRCRRNASNRRKQAAQILGEEVFSKLPFAGATRPISEDLTELVLNRTWRPQLAVTGMDGYPLPENAGNVLLPYSELKLSFRLPPTADAAKATNLIKKTLETDPPYGAEVEFDAEDGQSDGKRRRLRRGWRNPSTKSSRHGVRQTGRLHGRRRQHSFHGHAGREISQDAVRHHRRAWARIRMHMDQMNFSMSRQPSE